MKTKLIAALLFLIVLLPFVAASLSSSNYKITSYAVSGGGSAV